jgi:hypothetical protein
VSSEFNEKGLDSLLREFIDAFRLREELPRIGFPEQKAVTVSILNSNNEALATSQIQTSSNKFEPCLSLTDFREEFISFLNQDFYGLALIEALPEAKEANYIFSITSIITSVFRSNDCNTSSEYEEGENKVNCLPVKLLFSFAKRCPCPYDSSRCCSG